MSEYIHIFNQYYFDLLKKLKNSARDKKHISANAQKILKSIKANYSSYDKTSPEFVEWYVQNTSDLRSEISAANSFADVLACLQNEKFADVLVYKDITIKTVAATCENIKTLTHFVLLFQIFSIKEINETDIQSIINTLRNLKNKEDCIKSLEIISNTEIQKVLQILLEIQEAKQADQVHDSFKELEDTSLGKLAKEIMSDINVDDLQNTIGEDGDILKALGNPEGGLTKLLGTVSQKLLSKMASGELKQETLLQDALKFSANLSSMMPGGAKGAAGGLGDFGNILKTMSQMTGMGAGGGGADDIDLDELRSMMARMGTGAGAAGGAHGGVKTRTQFDTSSMSRVAKAKQLRRKLEKKRMQSKSKENVQTQVEDHERSSGKDMV